MDVRGRRARLFMGGAHTLDVYTIELFDLTMWVRYHKAVADKARKSAKRQKHRQKVRAYEAKIKQLEFRRLCNAI